MRTMASVAGASPARILLFALLCAPSPALSYPVELSDEYEDPFYLGFAVPAGAGPVGLPLEELRCLRALTHLALRGVGLDASRWHGSLFFEGSVSRQFWQDYVLVADPVPIQGEGIPVIPIGG